MRGEEVIHYTDQELQEGQTVTGAIDWDNRFSNIAAAFRGTYCIRINPRPLRV